MQQWGLLVRISDDRAGEGAGVDRQEKDGRALVAARGGTVAKVYQENDTGAFKRTLVVTLPDGRREKRVDRPDYRDALADLYHGRIDALAVYDLDRFVRDPRDLEDAVDVVEDTGRPIAAVTGSIDLSTDHGITMARVLVAVANKASRDTARRVRRLHVALAEQGRPSGGRRPYGYTADRKAVVEEEAEVLRELAARRLAGEGWMPLIRDLNARGIPAASGGPWQLSNIRSALLKPHIAGIRTLHGREVAVGTWPAILNRATWEQLRALAGEHRPPTRRYLLSGIARCGLCSAGMGGRPERGEVLVYRCSNPACMRISRRMLTLDAYVVGVALSLLAGVEPRPPADPATEDQARRVDALRDRRAAVVAAFADVDGADPLELRQALTRIDRDLAAAEGQLARSRRRDPVAAVRGLTAEAWEQLPLDTRRALLGDLLTVTVLPTRSGRRGFDASGVRVQRTGPVSGGGDR